MPVFRVRCPTRLETCNPGPCEHEPVWAFLYRFNHLRTHRARVIGIGKGQANLSAAVTYGVKRSQQRTEAWRAADLSGGTGRVILSDRDAAAARVSV